MGVDVQGYLLSKGLHLKRAGGDEIHTHCFFHGEGSNERGRLYININPDADIVGLYECKVCDAHGALPTIQRFFGDKPEKGDVEVENDLVRRQILEEAAVFYHHNMGDHEDVLKWLRGPDRGLTIETIVDRKLGYATGGLYKYLRGLGHKVADIVATGLVTSDSNGRTVDALNGMVTIPYTVAGNVVMIRGRKWPYDPATDEAKYKTPPRQATRLYNSDAFWNADDIIITEGEFDCLALFQLGFENVVAMPGANVWQDSWNGYVADMRRIFTVMDNDAAGSKGLARLIERHGRKVRQIDLDNGSGQKVDPTKWVQMGGTAIDFARLMKEMGGTGLLLNVDQCYEEWSGVQGVDGIKFNIELLDLMLEPGLLPGQVMVVLAKSGTGKTLFLLNLFERMAMVQPNLKFLFLSLEQTRGEWFERARRIHRFYDLRADNNETLNYWRPRLVLTDRNRLTETDILDILDDFEDQVGQPPDVVGLDYLGYFAQSFKGDRYERVSDAIMSLKGIGKERRIPFVVPHQVSRVAKYGEEPDADSARDAGVVEETADFLMTLWSQDQILGRSADDKTGVVNLRVGKSRHGGRGTKIEFQLAPLSLTLVPHGTTALAESHVHQARMELKYEKLRDRWETAVRRHLGLLPAGEVAVAIDDKRAKIESVAQLEQQRAAKLAALERGLR